MGDANNQTMAVVAEALRDAWHLATSNVDTTPPPISTLQLYQLGQVLAALSSETAFTTSSYEGPQELYHLQTCYDQLLQSIPVQPRNGLLRELHQGLGIFLEEQQSDTPIINEIGSSMATIAHLHLASPYTSSFLQHSNNEQLAWLRSFVQQLALLYSQMVSLQPSILVLLSRLIFPPRLFNDDNEKDTTVPADNDNRNDHCTQILLTMIDTLQEYSVWSDLIAYCAKQQQEYNEDWKDELLQNYQQCHHVEMDDTNRDYFMDLLASALTRDSASSTLSWTAPRSKTVTRTTKKISPVSAKDAIARRIQQVQDIVPNVNDGYVEAVLSYYQGNVERTVEALTGDRSALPRSLQVLDPSLPRRANLTTTDQERKEEEQAKQVTKQALQAAQDKEEQEAMLISKVMTSTAMDEYNDDYDDQYDEIDPIGNADSGLYDDYQAVKLYNQAYREAEDEQAFWQDNRNTNREQYAKAPSGKNPSKSGAGVSGQGGRGGSRYRGPDKLKGGRIPNAGRGRGGRGRGGRGRNDGPSVDQAQSAESGGQQEGNVKPNPRRKAAKMANRRDKQKKAAAKKAG